MAAKMTDSGTPAEAAEREALARKIFSLITHGSKLGKGESLTKNSRSYELADFILADRKAQRQALLERIEREVIGKDEELGRTMGPGMPSFQRDQLRAKQRTALKEILKDE